MLDADNTASHKPRTVQNYIDERPIWPDGTRLSTAPMTTMQWRIWMLAAAGKFFEGFVVFMGGVALPLIAREFDLGAAEKGMLGAASLFGILIGAVGLGSLSDRFGRKSMFIVEMIIFTAFLALAVFCTSFVSLLICLFGLGLALGCDYPTAHMIISESIPSTARGRLVLGAFAFQALGALGGTAVGYAVLRTVPDLSVWRWMYATAVVPAILVTIGRFYITESANWLSARGATDKRSKERAGCSNVNRNTQPISCWRRRPARAAMRTVEAVLSCLCLASAIAGQPYSPRCPGSCRTSAHMESASSHQLSWPPRSGNPRNTSAV